MSRKDKQQKIEKWQDEAKSLTDDLLLMEIEDQEQWASDEYFEYAAGMTGRLNLGRGDYIAVLHKEARNRGLFSPMPKEVSETEADG